MGALSPIPPFSVERIAGLRSSDRHGD